MKIVATGMLLLLAACSGAPEATGEGEAKLSVERLKVCQNAEAVVAERLNQAATRR